VSGDEEEAAEEEDVAEGAVPENEAAEGRSRDFALCVACVCTYCLHLSSCCFVKLSHMCCIIYHAITDAHHCR
jgi:hypothetical protein